MKLPNLLKASFPRIVDLFLELFFVTAVDPVRTACATHSPNSIRMTKGL